MMEPHHMPVRLDPEIEEKYEILQILGEGGMGSVYKVRHRHLDTIRVVKTSRLSEDASSQQRFLKEARSGFELTHPNVARVFDFDVTRSGIAYIVMEYVEGRNLRELLSKSEIRLPFDFTIEVTLQTLSALQYLHDRNIVHRDVAPDNLIVTFDDKGRPTVKLIDLGIAKAIEESSDGLTGTGRFIGKVAYAAPEQFVGDAIDRTADLYSLGVVLYQLVTTQMPFPARDFLAVVTAKISGEPRSFEETDPSGDVPRKLREVISRALQRDRKERFQSASEFAAALRDAAAEIPSAISTEAAIAAPITSRSEKTSAPTTEFVTGSAAREGRTGALPEPLTAEPQRQIPTKIGRFTILENVASGRTGLLFKAWDPVRGYLVGIKVPANDRVIDQERMLRAARIWLDMTHENIVRVFDVDPDGPGHRPLIVMELIDGVPLDRFAAEHSPTLDESIRIVRQVCRALQYVHERGVIHREVTPGNILVVRNTARVMLLDSGIARPVEAIDDDLTKSGSVVGDLAYMAPEQLAGHPEPRSDLFSLTGVFEFLLTKSPPSSDVVSILSNGVREFLIKGREVNPSNRFESAAAFEAALNDLASESNPPVAARAATHLGRKPSTTVIPKQLGRYSPLELIASGKTGYLYKAWDPVRGTLVGVKIPNAEDEVDRERMLRAARVWLNVSHDNIVRVYDVDPGGADHGPLIVTELIEGVRLDHYSRDRSPSLEDSIRLMAQVCRALQHIHSLGVIHREVTPQNILICRAGTKAMLLDSGIARPVEKADDGLTNAGTIVGEHLNYMAPEQLKGDPEQRSDVCSMAKVLYFLLTKRQPSTDISKMIDTLRGDMKIPDRVSDVIVKGLDADLSRRYESAAAFETALQDLLPLEFEPVPRSRMVVTLHGIRTNAAWQRSFSEVAAAAGFRCLIDRWNFGYYNTLRFLARWSRNARITWFRKTYQEEFPDLMLNRDARDLPSIVAHSFGTYILGHALVRYPYLRFDKVILCGSILPTEFDWAGIIARGQVQAVRNEHGSQDFWTHYVDHFVRGTGPSGMFGFSQSGQRIIQERFDFEHSEYFERGHMQSRWLPFLRQQFDYLPTRNMNVQRISSGPPSLLYSAAGLLISVLFFLLWLLVR